MYKPNSTILEPFMFLQKTRRAWAFCFIYFFIAPNVIRLGEGRLLTENVTTKN